jgi:hypothetical protein
MINGYELAYTHRGSWKATRKLKGRLVDEVPITWDKDYAKKPGAAPSLIVWFQDPMEAANHLAGARILSRPLQDGRAVVEARRTSPTSSWCAPSPLRMTQRA